MPRDTWVCQVCRVVVPSMEHCHPAATILVENAPKIDATGHVVDCTQRVTREGTQVFPAAKEIR